MFKNVNEYIEQLKKKLMGSDPALIQDALSDAEEHLRTALEETSKNTSGIPEDEALQSLVEKYGTPFEIASAYREIESRISPTLAPPRKPDTRPFFARVIGVFADPRAWGASLYMLISVLTGSIFGLWALFGISFSLITLVFVIGLPVTGLFLLSVRGIALIEGRIVEALLGVRMPRKSLFVRHGLNWKEKFKALITESHTWNALAYMILRFPLGMVYFAVIGTLFAASLKFTIYPVWYLALNRPLLSLENNPLFVPVWTIPFVSVVGFFLLTLTLHLAKFVGKIHGKFAKSLLVRK